MTSETSQITERTLQSLRANHFEALFAHSAAEAARMMMEMIPPSAVVGAADSATLRQMGVLEQLVSRGTEVVNPFTPELTKGMAGDAAIAALFRRTMSRALASDVFLCSSNALTEDGKIVSIDRVGNRVAGIFFGAPRVILPIGRNKIVKDVDAAIHRIKNVVAAAHARRKERRTPCAVTGKCNDCDSPERLCSITVIVEKKPLMTDLSVILIDEDLGLGWDPEWPAERIEQIRARYCDASWLFAGLPQRA